MKDGPDIARVAALIGDPARANILSALMDGRALTAGELAAAAGVTASTASIHLGKLENGQLVRGEKQGRHRYFALADPDVAEVLESLMGLAQRSGAVRVRTGPRDPELRNARVCYDHLAGEKGVQIFDRMAAGGLLSGTGEDLTITSTGRERLAAFGIDVGKLSGRRKLCRPCLDWSVRRDHLAGALGAAIWDRVQALGWAKRLPDSRVIRFTAKGEGAFGQLFRP